MSYQAIYQGWKEYKAQEFEEIDDAQSWLDGLMPADAELAMSSFWNDDGQFVESELHGNVELYLEGEGFKLYPVFGWILDMKVI